MALVLNEEQQMLKESAQGFLAEHGSLAELRKHRDAGSETGYADNLWRQMVEMGWAAILVPEVRAATISLSAVLPSTTKHLAPLRL